MTLLTGELWWGRGHPIGSVCSLSLYSRHCAQVSLLCLLPAPDSLFAQHQGWLPFYNSYSVTNGLAAHHLGWLTTHAELEYA